MQLDIGITKIDWHPEGNLLACGSSDKLIYVYDLRQDKLVYKSKRLHDGKRSLLNHILSSIMG